MKGIIMPEYTEEQKTRMAMLQWAMDFVVVCHEGSPLTGPEVALAALPLAQWVYTSKIVYPDSPPEATPDFDADELPAITPPGEVYVGGRQADGTLVKKGEEDEDEPECEYCTVNDDGTHN